LFVRLVSSAVLFFGLWQQPGFALPSAECIQSLQEIGLVADPRGIRQGRPIVEAVRGTEHLQYPAAFYEILSSLDFLEASPHRRSGGRGLRFVVVKADVQGINEQARLVAVILKHYFPNAEVVREMNPQDVELSDVLIELDDPTFFKGEFLDMLLAKPANAQPASLSRQTLREAFGIPQEANLLSVYAKHNRAEELWNWTDGFDAVMLSTNPGPYVDKVLPKNLTENFSVQALSEWRWNESLQPFERARKEGKSLLVLNDLTGYVPMLHALSNVAFIRGNLNYFEALNAGTPTLLSIDAKHEDVEPSLLRRGFSIAYPTKAFWFVSNESSVPTQLHDLSRRGPIDPGRRPYLIRAGEKTSLQAFVEALEAYLAPNLPDPRF